MLLRNLGSSCVKTISLAAPPVAHFSDMKTTITNLFKREPTVVVQDAILAQKAMVEGYDAGLNNFISK